MNSRRTFVALCVLLGGAELAQGQFQRGLLQPRRGRLSAVPQNLNLAFSCLDYGIKTPDEHDQYASVTRGSAFLIRTDGERLDLDDGLKQGWVTLRGTGHDGEAVAEIRTSGFQRFEIRPGAQILPRGQREVHIPKPALELIAREAAVEDAFEALPADLRGLLVRMAADARQGHVWGLYSRSRQSLDPALRSLPAVLDGLGALRKDASALPRLEWMLGRSFDAEERRMLGSVFAEAGAPSPGLSFLGDFLVLRRVQNGAAARSSLQAATATGLKHFELNVAGLRGLSPLLEACKPGRVVMTNELITALQRRRLSVSFDQMLTERGHRMVWRLMDDYLLLQPFTAESAVPVRVAVIAPESPAEARALFGQVTPAAYAFNKPIARGDVNRVKTLADLNTAAAAGGLLLICRQEYGRIRFADGSVIGVDELPPGVVRTVSCDRLDPRDQLSMDHAERARFGFEGLAAVNWKAPGSLGNADLLGALAEIYAAALRPPGAAQPAVMKVALGVTGDATVPGAAGTLLKITTNPAAAVEQKLASAR